MLQHFHWQGRCWDGLTHSPGSTWELSELVSPQVLPHMLPGQALQQPQIPGQALSCCPGKCRARSPESWAGKGQFSHCLDSRVSSPVCHKWWGMREGSTCSPSAAAEEGQGPLSCSHDSRPALPLATGIEGQKEQRRLLPQWCYCIADKRSGQFSHTHTLGALPTVPTFRASSTLLPRWGGGCFPEWWRRWGAGKALPPWWPGEQLSNKP